MNKSFKGVPLKYIGIAVLVILALIIGASLKKKPAKDSSDDYSKNVTESENKSKDVPDIADENKSLIKHYKDLTEEDLKELYNVCNDENATHIADEEQYETRIVSDPEYVGYFFRYHKKGYQNILGFIYKETLDEYEISEVDHYRVITFHNVKKEDGELEYLKEGTIDCSTELECYFAGVPNLEDFKCEGDDHFKKYIDPEEVGSLSEIDEESRKKLIEDAKSRVENFPRDYADSDSVVSDVKFEGEILEKKEDGNYDRINHYIVVCSATVSSKMNIVEPMKVYFPVAYHAIWKLKNGESTYYKFDIILGDEYMMRVGYLSDEDMFRECVSGQRAYYNGGYELSDSLKYLDEQYNRFKNED